MEEGVERERYLCIRKTIQHMFLCIYKQIMLDMGLQCCRDFNETMNAKLSVTYAVHHQRVF
jgi:hypothetical protein